MSKGTVKFFNDSKGYGFITEEGSNEDHFVHISGLIDEVREGSGHSENDLLFFQALILAQLLQF